MIFLEQLVPQEVCLSCDGCCRYAQAASVWSPLFLFEEIQELTQKNLVPSCIFSHAKGSFHKAARIDLVAHGDHFICPCFDEKTRQCKIYLYRPLDCRLYPFLLVRQEGRLALGVDMKCPYIREHLEEAPTREYTKDLQDFLSSPEFRIIAQNDPGIFQEYPSDVQVLAVLPEL
ncbi:MAG: YkgJ family cysteine cluster protein [Candidatus Omnitrophica bacterium]|nr:YkgJ family cysteine cluster protein [Candidatus Omnitrophota bacterium]MDD5575142.1 YkgJ family cysteine cluster protein [Candidatus Omnitrophota bacterium]